MGGWGKGGEGLVRQKKFLKFIFINAFVKLNQFPKYLSSYCVQDIDTSKWKEIAVHHRRQTEKQGLWANLPWLENLMEAFLISNKTAGKN